jgi:hypothetical protein
MVRPFGAYWYVFLESTMAILSFQPSSSAFCHGVSRPGMRNLTTVPCTKHCQAAIGQLCDHDGLCGEINEGELGTGDVLLSAADSMGRRGGADEDELVDKYLKAR